MSVPPPQVPTPPPSEPILPTLRGPEDLKALPAAHLPFLAQEIRDEIIQVTARQGGHVGPNLGVVELTMALHRVFSTPKDQFIFDVSHQGYVHKLLTGRREAFNNLRKTGGASGFLCRAESPHDAFGAGHAGTALSAAVGMAAARDLRGGDEHVVAVCGDAAFTCGITMEALNNIVTSTRRLIVILNDNEWSIARNVGAMARYLTRLTTSPAYNRIHGDLEKFFTSLPHGPEMHKMWTKWKRETKDFFMESSLFEKFGLRYIGPIDGHNLDALIKNLEFARQCDGPVLLHVLTKKGKGLNAAMTQPEKFHGLGAFNPLTGESIKPTAVTPPNYQDVFGKTLARLAQNNSSIVGVTAAMPAGTGLSHLAEACPKQFFDVGIAEEHAVLFAAGLAARGLRPVVAIYSTFLQRGFDQIVHDVCLQNLPVVFCLDRAGLSPNDGPTHHGLFDISFLRGIPNTTIMQPRDEAELADMLHTAIELRRPVFIRYPRGAGLGVPLREEPELLEPGKAQHIQEGSDIVLWALGNMVEEARALAATLQAEDGLSVGVVNARFAKPLDRELLLKHAKSCRLLATLEDHALSGGFGSAVLECLQEADAPVHLERIGWPDQFVEHGSSVESLRAAHGLSRTDLLTRLRARLRG